MKKTVCIWLSSYKQHFFVLWICFTSLSSGAQILNGDFATSTIGCNMPPAYWSSSAIIQVADYFQGGNNWVDITGCAFGNGNWIEQNVRTTPGMYYKISMDLGTWWGWGIEDAGVDITINGKAFGSRYFNDSFTKSFTVNLHWETVTTCEFLATDYYTKIRFTGHGLCSKFSPSTACANPNPGVIAIDNIRFSDSVLFKVDTNICINSDTGVLSYVAKGNIPDTAEWYLNGVSLGKTKTLKATVKGDYLLKIKAGCNISESHIIHFNRISLKKTIRICSGQTVKYGHYTYSKPGDYTDTLLGSGACDTMLMIRVELDYIMVNQNIRVCEGGVYRVNGHIYSNAGDYRDTVKGFSACDTIVQTHLVILAKSRFMQNVSICEGENLKVGSHSYMLSGTYTDTLRNYLFCDSIVTSVLQVRKVYHAYYKDSICEGDSFVFRGKSFFTTGPRVDTLNSYHGCDSIIELVLHFKKDPACRCNRWGRPVNVFTPDNDGINDYFPDYYMPGLLLWVYDRWGLLVYESNNGYGWNGTIRNTDLPAGTYYYLMEFNNCTSEHLKSNGVVTIIR